MGQSMKKLANGRADEKKAKEIGPIIERCYNELLSGREKDCTMAEFYRAVCQTVEEINKKVGGSHFSVPSTEDLQKAFDPLKKKETTKPYPKEHRALFFWTNGQYGMSPHETPSEPQDHHNGENKNLTKEAFGKILKEVILDTRFSGSGAKDVLLYIFGVPITTLFIKQQLVPTAIPNDVFIPGVTSATVFILAKLNKI